MLIDVVIAAHEEKLHGGDDLIIGKHDYSATIRTSGARQLG
jgi:hypothetical protein